MRRRVAGAVRAVQRRASASGAGLRRAARSVGPGPVNRALLPSSRFAILTAGRTGSELLVDLLDSHPEIVCDSEVLGTRRARPHRFLGRRAALARLAGARAYGFKLIREHAGLQELGDAAEFLLALHERGTRIILLERRDLLQQSLSHIRAAGTRYHQRRGERVVFSPITVDPEAVVATMWYVESAVQFARASLAEIPHLQLFYEDHLADERLHQSTADLVCEFLGLPSRPVSSDLVKIAPRTVGELVTNFDELAELLSRTRYASYLSAAEAPAGAD